MGSYRPSPTAPAKPGSYSRGLFVDRNRRDDSQPRDNFSEKLVQLNRTAKVVKGGRSFSFSALTVVGDHQGNVGYGFGKAKDVTEAIRKSTEKARRAIVHVPVKNGTLPHEIVGKYKATNVMIKPAVSGSGVIAGGPVRAIMEAAGYTDVISKCIGSRNSMNIVRAVFDGAGKLLDAKTVAKNRGKSLKDLWG